MTIRSGTSSTMDVNSLELSELSAIFDFVYTLASANINQSAPNSVKICVTIRSWAEPHSSVGSIADLGTGRWFNPRLGQYSFRGLMIAIATGFIPLTPLSNVSTMVMWEAASGLERIMSLVLVIRTPEKHG